jgi:hypothetical protein
MRVLFSIITLLSSTLILMGQPLSSYDKTLNYGYKHTIKELVGKELTILKSPNEPTGIYHGEKLDTFWIKKVSNPKLNKHYKLIHTYKGIPVGKHKDGIYFTPSHEVEGRIFDIIDVTHLTDVKPLEVGYHSGISNLGRLKLKDKSTGEIIYMELGEYQIYKGLEFKIVDNDVFNKIVGETFIDELYKTKHTVSDCYYLFTDGQHYSSHTIVFTDGTTLGNNSLDIYELKRLITLSDYQTKLEEEERKKKEKEMEQLKLDSNSGYYHLVFNNITKPKSSKFTKGKVSTNNITGQTSYDDNHISLKIYPEDDCFRFSIKNLSQNTMIINWDDVIFIDENSESQRMVHSGIRYIHVNSPQTPSKILKNTMINDVLIPVHRVYNGGINDILHRCGIRSLFTEGTLVHIVLPIEMNGVSYEYTISYEIKWKWRYPEKRKLWLEMTGQTE